MLYAATRRSEGFSQGEIRRHCGSVPGHIMVNRDRVEVHERLYHDYFATPCVYESFFRMRFRMSRPLFLRIVNEVEQYDPYFIQRIDAIGVLGLSSLQKITTTYRILAYGTPADYVDEYIRIGESTVIESEKVCESCYCNVWRPFPEVTKQYRYCSIATNGGTTWFSWHVREY